MQTQSKTCHVIVLTSACILCYINSLQCGLLFDDEPAILKNADVIPAMPIWRLFEDDYWGTPMASPLSHGSYRPLTTLTFRWNYLFSQFEPMAYHVVNVALHVFVTMLIYWCSILLTLPLQVAFVTTILFAVHPIHSEAVTGVVGRAELLSSAFFFLAMICYIQATKKRGFQKVGLLLGAIAAIPLGSLCKETGMTVAGLLVVYEILVIGKWQPPLTLKSFSSLLNFGSVLRLASVIITSVSFLRIRFKLMPHMPTFKGGENPASEAPNPIRQLTFAYVVPLNFQMLLYPWKLCGCWGLRSIPLITGWSDPRNVITLIFFVAFVYVAFRLISRPSLDLQVAFAMAFMTIPFIPASNLLFIVGFVVAERILYLPSFGFCVLVAIGYQRLTNCTSKRKGALTFILWTSLLLVSTAFSSRTIVRNFDWRTDLTFYKSGIRFNPGNAKFYGNAGSALMIDGQFDVSFAYTYKCLQMHPRSSDCLWTMSAIFYKLRLMNFFERNHRQHLAYLSGVVTSRKSGIISDLAFVLTNSTTVSYGKLLEADILYGMLLDIQPKHFTAYERRGEVLFRLGRYDEAREMFKRPLKSNAKCGTCFYNLAVVNLTQFQNDDEKLLRGLQAFEKAIRFEPQHYYAMNAFASVVLQRRLETHYDQAKVYVKQIIEAEQQMNVTLTRGLTKVISLPEKAFKNNDAAIAAAKLEAATGNLTKCLEYLRLASERDEDSQEALFNLAWLLYRKWVQPKEAKVFVEKLLEKQSNNTNSWLLLGCIHLKLSKNQDKASEAVENALKADESHHQNSTVTTVGELLLRCPVQKSGDTKLDLSCLESVLEELLAYDDSVFKFD